MVSFPISVSFAGCVGVFFPFPEDADLFPGALCFHGGILHLVLSASVLSTPHSYPLGSNQQEVLFEVKWEVGLMWKSTRCLESMSCVANFVLGEWNLISGLFHGRGPSWAEHRK